MSIIHLTKLTKAGGSTKVIIPKRMLKELGWKDGHHVALQAKDGVIIVHRTLSYFTTAGNVIKVTTDEDEEN